MKNKVTLKYTKKKYFKKKLIKILKKIKIDEESDDK